MVERKILSTTLGTRPGAGGMATFKARILDVTEATRDYAARREFEIPAMLPVFDEAGQLIGEATDMAIEETKNGRRYLVGYFNVTRRPKKMIKRYSDEIFHQVVMAIGAPARLLGTEAAQTLDTAAVADEPMIVG